MAVVFLFAIVPAIILIVFCLALREARFRRIATLWVSLSYVASMVLADQIARGPSLAIFIIVTGYVVQIVGPLLHIAILRYSDNTLPEWRFAVMLIGSVVAFIALIFVVAALSVSYG